MPIKLRFHSGLMCSEFFSFWPESSMSSWRSDSTEAKQPRRENGFLSKLDPWA
jgi:hypothetical protein